MRARFRRRCRCAEFCWAIRGLCRYEPGDVIVREGDYGNSAFLDARGHGAGGAGAARSEAAGPRRAAAARLAAGDRTALAERAVARGATHGRRATATANGTNIRDDDGTRAGLPAGRAAAVVANGHGAAWRGRDLWRAGGDVAHAADGDRACRWPGHAAGNPLAGFARPDAADAGDSRARRAAVSREQLARAFAGDASC